MRISLNVLNAINDRQKVRDSARNIPLQYRLATAIRSAERSSWSLGRYSRRVARF
jgi:hypothetical protein